MNAEKIMLILFLIPLIAIMWSIAVAIAWLLVNLLTK